MNTLKRFNLEQDKWSHDNKMVESPNGEYVRFDDIEPAIQAQAFLDCLVCSGVDNWSGYEDAREMLAGGQE